MSALRAEHNGLPLLRGANQRPLRFIGSRGIVSTAAVAGSGTVIHQSDGLKPGPQARTQGPAARCGGRRRAAAGTRGQRLLPNGAAVLAQQEQRGAAPGASAARAADRGEGPPGREQVLGLEQGLQAQGPGIRRGRGAAKEASPEGLRPRRRRRRRGQLGDVDLEAVSQEEEALASTGHRDGGEELVGPWERDQLRVRGPSRGPPRPRGAGQAEDQGQAPEHYRAAGHLHEVLPGHARLVVPRPGPAPSDILSQPVALLALLLEVCEAAFAVLLLQAPFPGRKRRGLRRHSLQRDDLGSLRGLPRDLAGPRVDKVLDGLAGVCHMLAQQPPAAHGGRRSAAHGPPSGLASLPQLLQMQPLSLCELFRVPAFPQQLL
mmetsp:Transcript_99031/g.295841  ORF Transcript_99031/g.295841 Transcript_99031/m.295841 type:complete len:376 (-) Transcript_99031:1553-2680(-)